MANLRSFPTKGIFITVFLMLGLMGGLIGQNFFWAADSHGNFRLDMQQVSSPDYYRQGVQAYRRGEFQEAMALLQEAHRHDAGNPNIRYYLAICYDKLVRYNDALLQYQYVAEHGEDPQVVDFSRYRLRTLQERMNLPVAVASTHPASTAASTSQAENTAAAKNLSPTISIVPLKKSTQALLVEATLNDKSTGTFILDTGATYTSISRELAESLGLDLENAQTVRITTANGRIEVPKVVIKRISVNGLEARDVEVTVIDIRKGSSFSGLLGLSFIKKFKLTIDPEAGQLIFQQN